ncbi:ABC transporter ATP-binding protein [Lacticaseibacillus paracasei]|uniref:ABC transporter ATP-binding protein n=1 Tax=Lacticaseibacillus paracasei TaxID=1597 RepID=UPI0002975202|nr:ATP-binding component of an ABC superfamily transporter [Lacticaseibacillus paracasei]
MTTAIIELDHLQKNFGKFAALKDVSFTLAPGQVLGFLGPNGAGKSTTIRVILGLLKKSGGSVTVFGKDAWRDDAAIHPRIAYIPGDVYLWPNLSGGEIIDLLLRLNGRQHNQKTDELIKAFEFDPKKKARTYSKGNRQKVALIAALSQDADLYIFDEPTSGLDPLNEQTFQQEVLKLKRAGKSVLLSSHILSEVERMCDSIVIIRDGSVIESGNLDQLRHLSRIKIEVSTATPMTDLAKQAGVNDLTYRDSEHTKAVFTADRDALGTIMTTLAANTVVDMQSTPPTLEDLFLRYYGKQGETHAAQ